MGEMGLRAKRERRAPQNSSTADQSLRHCRFERRIPLGRRVAYFLVLLLVVWMLQPETVSAGTDGTSRTYLRSWESTDGKVHTPLFEYLDLDTTLGTGGPFSFHFGGWGRVDLGEETDGRSSRGELQYGYFTWNGGTGNRVARAGRIEVSGGVAAAERLDGLSLGSDLVGGFSAAAYAGVPVETDGDGRAGDFLYGGRLAHRIPGFSEFGISYLRESNDSEEGREEEGLDILLRPHRMITLDGRSVYSPDLSVWMEHQYRAVIVPLPSLTITGEYQKVDYRSFFRSPDVSAFAPAGLAGEEGLQLIGAEAAYAVTPAVTAALFWRGYTYEVAGDAHSTGARLGYGRANLGLGLAYFRVSGEVPSLRYSEYGGYAFWRAGRTDLALDLRTQSYDEQINGRDRGTTASLAAGYAVRPALRLAADASYTVDPTYSKDVRGMLKVTYGFSLAGPKP